MEQQLNLFALGGRVKRAKPLKARLSQFDGAALERGDEARLSSQLARVKALMADGHWRTLKQISDSAKASEAAASARLRDLRKARFGQHVIVRRYVGGGLWEYRMVA